MADEIIEKIKKDKDTSMLIADQLLKFSRQTLSTQADTAREVLKNNIVLCKAIEELGDEIADMDEELEDKDNKITYLKSKIGISDKEFTEEFSKIHFNKQDIERHQRVLNRMRKREERHEAISNIK